MSVGEDLLEPRRRTAPGRRSSPQRCRPGDPGPHQRRPGACLPGRPAARAISEQLPEAVAVAVIGFPTGPLVEPPHRIGTPLRRELVGLHSARRGTFPIVYRIDDEAGVVTVVRVEHHSDFYRSG